MTRGLSRRQALSAFGTVSLGPLLGACGGSGDDGAPTTSTPVPTEEGGTATVEPQSPSGDGLVEKLDASATCRQAVEQTEGPYYFDADRIRSDIREDRDGTLLKRVLLHDPAQHAAIEKEIEDLLEDRAPAGQ